MAQPLKSLANSSLRCLGIPFGARGPAPKYDFNQVHFVILQNICLYLWNTGTVRIYGTAPGEPHSHGILCMIPVDKDHKRL